MAVDLGEMAKILLSAALVVAVVAATDPTTCQAPTAMGCFVDPYKTPDGTMRRVLNYTAATHDSSLTRESCIAACCKQGYDVGALAGIEAGHDCFCDKGFGPYIVPQDHAGCQTPCTGNKNETCGGAERLEVYTITQCPGVSFRPTPFSDPAPLQRCGAAGCTRCPAGDTCCIGHSPDPYRVPGGYGCAPPNSSGTSGCAGGGTFPGGCCCGPGPSSISGTEPNVLMIGDSVSAGYISAVKARLAGEANVQHGPDNAGGGNADSVTYGRLCLPYFIRTPLYQLPSWDVISFNFGLHDAAETNSTYRAGLISVTEQLRAATDAALVYFLTTIPGGAHSVPGEPVSPSDRRVMELNEIARQVMATFDKPAVQVVDLYESMRQCGEPCYSCKPHCGPEGYQYLSDHAIVPAIKKALAQRVRPPAPGEHEDIRLLNDMVPTTPATSTDCRTNKQAAPISIRITNGYDKSAGIRGCQNQIQCKPYKDCDLGLPPNATETITFDASFKYFIFTSHGEGQDSELYPDANLHYPAACTIYQPPAAPKCTDALHHA